MNEYFRILFNIVECLSVGEYCLVNNAIYSSQVQVMKYFVLRIKGKRSKQTLLIILVNVDIPVNQNLIHRRSVALLSSYARHFDLTNYDNLLVICLVINNAFKNKFNKICGVLSKYLLFVRIMSDINCVQQSLLFCLV